MNGKAGWQKGLALVLAGWLIWGGNPVRSGGRAAAEAAETAGANQTETAGTAAAETAPAAGKSNTGQKSKQNPPERSGGFHKRQARYGNGEGFISCP